MWTGFYWQSAYRPNIIICMFHSAWNWPIIITFHIPLRSHSTHCWCIALTASIWLTNEWSSMFPQNRGEGALCTTPKVQGYVMQKDYEMHDAWGAGAFSFEKITQQKTVTLATMANLKPYHLVLFYSSQVYSCWVWECWKAISVEIAINWIHHV